MFREEAESKLDRGSNHRLEEVKSLSFVRRPPGNTCGVIIKTSLLTSEWEDLEVWWGGHLEVFVVSRGKGLEGETG